MWLFHFNIITSTNSSQSGTSPWPRTWDTQPSLPTHHVIQEAGRWSGGLTPWHNIIQHSENRVVTHTYSANSLKWRQEDQDPGQGHLQLCGDSEGRLSYIRPHSHLPTAPPRPPRTQVVFQYGWAPLIEYTSTSCLLALPRERTRVIRRHQMAPLCSPTGVGRGRWLSFPDLLPPPLHHEARHSSRSESHV